MNMKDIKERLAAALQTPTGLDPAATRDISGALNLLLADVYALYIKTKNFHWHVSAPHFRDHHLLLDEQADQTSPSGMQSPSASARSVGQRCVRLLTSRG